MVWWILRAPALSYGQTVYDDGYMYAQNGKKVNKDGESVVYLCCACPGHKDCPATAQHITSLDDKVIFRTVVAHNHEAPAAVQRSLSRVVAKEIKGDLAKGVSPKNIVRSIASYTHMHTFIH